MFKNQMFEDVGLLEFRNIFVKGQEGGQGLRKLLPLVAVIVISSKCYSTMV